MSSSSATSVPSSLTSPPVKATVEPDNCQFTDVFEKVPLLENVPVSKTSFIARFGLPDASKSLGLSTCACILAGVEIDGEMVVRPYTPISTNADVGTFDLLVKKYPDGKMSSFLSDLKPSDEKVVAFKHISFNVKTQYPFNSPKVVVMLAGGTGITPMIQALHAILGDEEGTIEKTHLIYGSRNQDDILGKEMLDKWADENSDKLSVTHVLSYEEAEISGDGFKKGFIDRKLIESIVPPPSAGSDVLIFVCGPPIMYDVLCGDRTEAGVTGLLGDIGYSSDQVYKF
jgi:cytochrome-b5 reductase